MVNNSVTIETPNNLELLTPDQLLTEINGLLANIDEDQLRKLFACFADQEGRENFLDQVTVTDVLPDQNPLSGLLTVDVFVEKYIGCKDMDDAYDKTEEATYFINKNSITITTEPPDWDARYPADEL